MKKLLFILFFPFISSGVFAQTKDLTGTVINDKNEPITGATVRVKGNAQSTNTDDNGVFVLKGIPDTSVLVISATGYQESEVATVDQNTISITLSRSNFISVHEPLHNAPWVGLMNHSFQKKVNCGVPGSIMINVKRSFPGCSPGLIPGV